ncbi:centrosomal protein of 78 kDa [Sitophilus oryzae]|uniref:Centrosomal protein of 78 kDa n=1 Tax=Sitophilus oryzae TaxID=7048 RepID=A0A6J2YP74_SITOR|nr:centrosomal protein of 78 kDa [Sitophilus oryzae]
MEKPKSSVVKSNNPKPVSVFYVWYAELCRRLNINPSTCVKPAKPKCQTVLDFVADRLKVEDWNPVLNALRQDTSLHVIAVRSKIGNCQFLHDVDTEEKARNVKRKYGSIWTAYILRQVLKSLSYTLRSTQVLTYLELEGLPLFMQYLEPLMQALKKNKTLKSLSFSNCLIQDIGCQMVCSYLRFTPNIEILNLSGCNLSPVSGEHLAKLIKYQQINRYCESWHNSLRYENPDAGKMRGIKRITINCNTFFGDAGLSFILNELEDDLWVKALDMQRCGFTENLASRIIDVVEYNKTLEIVDLRRNELLTLSTIEKVLHALQQRQRFGMQSEFQWCATAVSLTWSSIYSSASKSSLAPTLKSVHKTRSAPMKSSSSKASAVTWDPTVRKTRTLESVNKSVTKFASLQDTKKQVLELNDKLQKEIQKRKEIEKKNEELQCQLKHIKTNSYISSKDSSKQIGPKDEKKTIKVNGINGIKKPFVPNGLHVKKVEIRNNVVKEPNNPPPLVMRRKEGKKTLKKECPANGIVKNGLRKNGIINGFKNQVPNGYNNQGSHLYNILEKILSTGKPLEENIECEMMNYLNNNNLKDEDKATSKNHSISTSQVSLYQYMEELKTDNT